MKKSIILIFGFLLSNLGLQAQNTYEGNIIFSSQRVVRKGGILNIEAVMDLSNMKLSAQQMATLTPVIVSNDGVESHQFAPIIIAGKKRFKILNRSQAFGTATLSAEPMYTERRCNDKLQTIDLYLRVPYQKWMHEARLVIKEKVTGCIDCDSGQDEYTVMASILNELFIPKYELSYVVPPVEPLKQRTETHSAFLNFEVDKYVLLRNYKNNINVLTEIDRIVNEIQYDPNLTVTEFTVVGYASPEGNFNSNMALSKNRAFAFVDYLKDKLNVNESLLTVEWKGEDWNGLSKVVAESSIPERQAVLDILDNTPEVILRKQKLKTLNGGITYKFLLREYYPSLRRNDYSISYVARPFNVEEARTLIKTKPQYLSLNEMFLVAETYPKNSKEFKEVFDVAARVYPDNPIAQLNTASLELENGAVNVAIERLMKLDVPEAWNNLGVAYVMNKDYQKGKEYFEKAAEAGVKNAVYNAGQLTKWLETQE